MRIWAPFVLNGYLVALPDVFTSWCAAVARIALAFCHPGGDSAPVPGDQPGQPVRHEDHDDQEEQAKDGVLRAAAGRGRRAAEKAADPADDEGAHPGGTQTPEEVLPAYACAVSSHPRPFRFAQEHPSAPPVIDGHADSPLQSAQSVN